MKFHHLIELIKIVSVTIIFVLSISYTQAGEPPFPHELLYPNVVQPTHQFGSYGQRPGQYSDPVGACFMGKSRIAVVEASNRRVQIISTSGESISIWERFGGSAPIYPTAIACSKDLIIVADAGKNEVVVLDYSGRLLLRIGRFGAGEGEFNNPLGVAIGNGVFGVADAGNNRIQVFGFDGALLKIFGGYGTENGRLINPMSVAFDENNNVFVADSWNNRITKFSLSSQSIQVWGEWGSHAGLFATPSSVTVRGNHLYVTDLTNHRIQVFDLFGHYLFQWGRHPVYGHDGNGRTHYPWSLAIDPDEDVFALVEPVENRLQIFEKANLKTVKNVNDSAWWDKATRFHYGSRSELEGALMSISEPDTHSVLMFDVSGDQPLLIARLGGRGTALGKLIEPSGMALSPAKGEVLVTDAGNLRLQTLSLVRPPENRTDIQLFATRLGFLTDIGIAIESRATVFKGVAGSDDPPNVEKMDKFAAIASARPLSFNLATSEVLIYPGALKRAKDGEIYLYDQALARIIIMRDGKVRKVFGGYGSEAGKFKGVHNMAFSRDGTKLFVVDSYNFRVQIFDRDGNHIKDFGTAGHADSEFSHIFGIAAGIDGYVYITDEAKHCFYKYTEEGVFVHRYSRWGTEPGELYKPKGISQDERGRLYILSFGNHRGEIFLPDGTYLGPFGLADPETQRGKEMAEALRSRPQYTPSTRSILDRDTTALFNAPRVQQIDPARLSVISNAGNYKLYVKSSAPLSELDKPKILNIKVTDSNGRPADVELEFDAQMPAHGHGLTTAPELRKIGRGAFEVSNIELGMPGNWDLLMDIHSRAVTERAQFSVWAK